MMSKLGIAATMLLLSSCNHLPDWLGAGEDPPLPGERYSVMSLDNSLEPDESIKFDEVILNPQSKNLVNPQYGNHYISGNLNTVKTASAGNAAASYFFITSKPVFAANMIFVMDGSHTLRALDLNLKQIWEAQIKSPEDKEDYPTGGITAKDGIIYATTGFGDVVATNLQDGSEIWRANLQMPVRNAPVVYGGRVFAITNSNDLFAFDAETGENLWRHNGVSETTKIFGTSAPAVKNNMVVAAYSSGEIFGINATQGQEIWTELLSLSSDRTKASASINDITASPIIVDGIAYITSHTGNLSAFNITNGFRIWERAIASGTTPFVSDRYLFVTGDDGKVFAINRFDGRIKWATKLPKDDQAFFSGPIVAGDQVLVLSSEGLLFKIDPKTGNIAEKIEVPNDIYSPISVFNGKVYLYSNDAKLIQID